MQRVIKPGQVIFGIREIAKFWDISKDTVVLWLEYLCKTDRITIETSTRGSLATILNWEAYQGSDDEEPTVVSTKGRRVPDTDQDAHPHINIEVKKERINKHDQISFEVHPELRDTLTDPLLAKTKPEQQEIWLKTYSNPEWIKDQLRRLVGWLEVNPHKKSRTNRGTANRINNWLSNGKDRQATTGKNGALAPTLTPKKQITKVPGRSPYAD